MDYYYSLDNQPMGPVPLAQIHELYRTGVITLETLVVPVGGTEWKPYSTLHLARQDPAGSAVPGDLPLAENAPGQSAAASTPPLSSPQPAAPAASSPLPPLSRTPQPGYKNLVLISWVLLGATALVSVIPVLGCFSWLMLIPVFITTVILGVLTLQRGGTTEGVLILVAAIVVLPLFTVIAPILTTALFGAVTGLGDEKRERTSPAPVSAAASPTPSVR